MQWEEQAMAGRSWRKGTTYVEKRNVYILMDAMEKIAYFITADSTVYKHGRKSRLGGERRHVHILQQRKKMLLLDHTAGSNDC